GAEAGVRVHRAQDDGVCLARDVDVVEVAAAAAQEPDVLDPLDALSDAVLAHQPRPLFVTASASSRRRYCVLVTCVIVTVGADVRRAPRPPSATPRPTCRPAPAQLLRARRGSCSARGNGSARRSSGPGSF